MSKLRVIKERTTLGNHEQDLRELGGTTLLSNTGVESILTLRNLSPLEISKVQQVVTSKHSMKFESSGNSHKITCHAHHNYKVNTLHLFHVALILIHKGIVNTIHQHEINHLKNELSHAANKKVESIHHEDLKHGLHLSAQTTHTLNQAGYSVSACNDSLHLSAEHVVTLISSLTSAQAAKKLRSA